MKFQDSRGQEALRRLMSSPDFRYYVSMLWGDYKRAVAQALAASSADAEKARGFAHALHTQLKDLGIDPDKNPMEPTNA